MLVDYAEKELRRAGLFDKDSDYDEEIGPAVLELVRKFAAQGHSGFSADLTLSVFDRVARFKPLTEITSNPDEWMEVQMGEMWQSTRQPTLFSKDGGKTWYDLDTDQTGVTPPPSRMMLSFCIDAQKDGVSSHVYFKCKCNRWGCQFCDGGLASCTVCGGFEGSLLPECPGRPLPATEHDKNYSENLERWARKARAYSTDRIP